MTKATKNTKSNQIKITLKKSVIGRIPKHVNIVKQLGLKKLNSHVIHNDIPAIRGLVNQVNYLLEVQEL